METQIGIDLVSFDTIGFVNLFKILTVGFGGIVVGVGSGGAFLLFSAVAVVVVVFGVVVEDDMLAHGLATAGVVVLLLLLLLLLLPMVANPDPVTGGTDVTCI